jgi:hypothetical protein
LSSNRAHEEKIEGHLDSTSIEIVHNHRIYRSEKKGNTIIVKELVDGINMEFKPGDAVEADGERMITKETNKTIYQKYSRVKKLTKKLGTLAFCADNLVITIFR